MKEIDIKPFPDKQKLREFVASSTTLPPNAKMSTLRLKWH